MKLNLKGLSRRELEEFFLALGEPKYRASQTMRWIYKRGVTSSREMTDLSKALRAKLEEIAYISRLKIKSKSETPSKDTIKYLFELEDGNTIESVLLLYDRRTTICISSQVGCAYRCDFCAIGEFIRDLAAAEIVDQVLTIRDDLWERENNRTISNIVLIGECFANYNNVLKAIRLLIAEEGLHIGARHIIVPTCGLAPQIRRFAREGLQVRLAVSLNATSDRLRDVLMPINKRYPLGMLLEACRYYVRRTGRRITLEYNLISEVNDELGQAHRLADLLEGIPCNINLIPFNSVEGTDYERPSRNRVYKFQQILKERGFEAVIRAERGVGLNAVCEQLRGKYERKARR